MSESQSPRWRNVCCNPFNKPSHYIRNKRQLRSVTKWMCEKASILHGEKICHDCRKRLAKEIEILTPRSPDIDSQIPTPQSPDFAPLSPDFEKSTPRSPDFRALTYNPPDSPAIDEVLQLHEDTSKSLVAVNQCLDMLGETPLTKSKLRSKQYSKQKVEKVTTMMQKLVISDPQTSTRKDDSEIVQQLKQKFVSASRSEKIQILTVLPKTWTIRRVQAEFGATNHMVRKAKQLVEEKGILATPNPKPGHSLPQTTQNIVTSFYESDENSRMMPGRKDFVSVRKEEGRVHVQKRLILCNLKELFRLFKDRFPHLAIGFSKFADLRPKHCILAGSSGTHSVCVCTFHQNIKLMMVGAKLSELAVSSNSTLTTYHHYIAQVICNPPLPQCYLHECSVCPGMDDIKTSLTAILDDNMIDNISYKQWTNTDRSTLETVSSTVDDFVEAFCEQLKALVPHSFIASQQASFYTECKSNLLPGEVLVAADFSENYSFIVQDAAQGFHWNNAQATVHPFVVYYKHEGDQRHLSYVVISDCLKHDTVSVYLFQKCLITFLKRVLPFSLRKVIYFTDGAASQYKNRKNFLNLCNHEADFDVNAEWHFSATSHGKGACDGVGGTVKRLAAKASLQKPYDEQIMSPLQLFEWASANIPGIVFKYCSTEEYEEVKSNLETRFQKSRTVPGTRKLHSFIPLTQDTVEVRPFSASNNFKKEKVTKQENELEIDEISGFVTCAYDNQWWLACVLEVDQENSEVQLSYLHPYGPSKSFRYPSVPDLLTVPVTDVLTKVSPRNASRHTYTLTQRASKAATAKLNTRTESDV